ncbi:LytTR family DNA-binding domain-containing protein [Phocaeicola sp.]
MRKLKEYLNRPTYAVDRPWTLVLLNATAVGLILAIFEPFHYRLNSLMQFWVLWAFIGLAFTLSILSFIVAPKIFKRFYDPDQWTIGKNIVHCFCFLLVMGICTFIYDRYFLIKAKFWNDWNTDSFYVILSIDMLAAFTIGIIPLLFGLFIVENNALKRNLLEAQKLNKLLSERTRQEEEETTKTITLSGDTKDAISLPPESILYMEASGNYVDICYKEDNKEKHKLLRSTIKQMEEVMLPHNNFIRCHRAYIVNINHIRNISGNAQGYRLSLTGATEEIPVSRTYLKDLKGLKDILS